MKFSSYDTVPPTPMRNNMDTRATLLVPVFSCRRSMPARSEVHVCSITFTPQGPLYTVMDKNGETISGIPASKIICVPAGMMEAVMDGAFDDDGET